MKKVLVGGVFNILHPGHIFFLEKARALGDELIVVVAKDENVKKQKGKEAVLNEKERVIIIGALKPVDKAVVGDSFDFLKVVEEFKPDIIALGYDQDFPNLEKDLRKKGLNAKIVRINEKFEEEKHKSSKIIERIKKSND